MNELIWKDTREVVPEVTGDYLCSVLYGEAGKVNQIYRVQKYREYDKQWVMEFGAEDESIVAHWAEIPPAPQFAPLEPPKNDCCCCCHEEPLNLTLEDTVPFMLSENFEERLIAEYWQLVIRYNKLDRAICHNQGMPAPVFVQQLKVMREYMRVLEERAKIADVDLNKIFQTEGEEDGTV